MGIGTNFGLAAVVTQAYEEAYRQAAVYPAAERRAQHGRELRLLRAERRPAGWRMLAQWLGRRWTRAGEHGGSARAASTAPRHEHHAARRIPRDGGACQ